MKDECKHKFCYRHPNVIQCIECKKCIPVVCMKTMSQEEFEKQYGEYPKCGPVIFDELN